MKSITVAELRQNPTAALEDVAAGETYVVTRHRHPVARLVPVDSESSGIIPPRNPAAPRLAERDLPRKSAKQIDALLAEMASDR
ncbi:hypothetical protein EB75_14740 [Mycobacterium sp. ST-F2]|uniref:type II toxin-antitoxin system Phd/YefM family antitoxin n=1 Tax=Mycobacterium sp. ST-F2 TaxID=1490484 RepID=UPI00093A4A41|nr:type II toxin-antitoxin system Phd/YefM family antitoxin [Mycobacterium sp. ST-F2]OKH81767.1 hypothetical protein EB75_14740 [Mycobacterium sp. ST-F2]